MCKLSCRFASNDHTAHWQTKHINKTWNNRQCAGEACCMFPNRTSSHTKSVMRLGQLLVQSCSVEYVALKE